MADKHMKRYLVLLAIKERQIKTAMRYHSPLARMLIIKRRERQRPAWTTMRRHQHPHALLEGV